MAEGDYESREEIVTSLICLSETLCENALKLSNTETEASAKNLVARGKRLQKKSKESLKKQKKTDQELPIESKSRNDVEISCCTMEHGRKGYVRCSPLYNVDLNRSDKYEIVISKICKTIGIEENAECRLFNGKGAIIQNHVLNLRDKEIPWTLGGFLLKRHKSPDTTTLGVGHLEEEDVFISKTKPTVQSAHPGQSKCSYPPEVTSSDTVKVYYAACNGVVPLTRSEVWNEINGFPGGMDKYAVFYPENTEYRVISISLISDGKEFRILHLNKSGSGAIPAFVKGDSPFCFTSYTKPVIASLLDCVPLVALCHMHPHCTYKWECCNDPNEKFPSTPVVYVRNPLLYMCSVTFSGRSTVLGSVHFDISFDPDIDINVANPLSQVSEVRAATSKRSCNRSSPEPSPGYELMYISPPKFDSQQFFPEEILKATDNLNKSNEIGSGGYGNVFIARDLRSIGTVAAIKVLNSEGSGAIVKGASASNMIENEIRALMKFRHPNILQIMGYCFSPTIKALIYRYVENGSLHSWIHTDRSCQLSWEQRKSVLKDVLKGLAFLHAGESPLIHQDIKSHNVLLDSNLCGIVGDFGFALEIPKSVSGRTQITAPLIARTEGYLPPELISGKISPLSDVYSCGVLTLEVYTSLMPFCKNRPDNELASYTEDGREDINQFLEIADKSCGVVTIVNAEKFLRVSNACLQRYSKRPTANEALVLWEK